MVFFFRVATIHRNWDFWEPLHKSEYVDFPQISKISAYSQRRRFLGCFRYKYRDRQKMLTLWLFATRLFSVSLAYRYVGNDYTSGTNNAPSVDIKCSKFLPSLMQVKFLLAFLIKLFFFFLLCQMIWLSQRILMGSHRRVLFIHCSSVLYTERQPQLWPASTYSIPLQTHFK